MNYSLGILGAGNMAEAIVRGVTAAGVLRGGQILAADVSVDRRALFEQTLGVRAVESGKDVASQCSAVLLSVKPQQMADVLRDLGSVMPTTTLVISIAAGISTAFIEEHLGGGKPWRIVRTMPNQPMLVGQGMVGLSAGKHATADDVMTARQLFEAAADVVEVPEDQLHAVTAVSGSGPAYFYFLVEQMIRAGVEMGLPHHVAAKLANQTALGAATMLTQSAEDAATLRRKVTSPNGTTQAAIERMQARGVDASIVAALHAAERRSRELAGERRDDISAK